MWVVATYVPLEKWLFLSFEGHQFNDFLVDFTRKELEIEELSQLSWRFPLGPGLAFTCRPLKKARAFLFRRPELESPMSKVSRESRESSNKFTSISKITGAIRKTPYSLLPHQEKCLISQSSSSAQKWVCDSSSFTRELVQMVSLVKEPLLQPFSSWSLHKLDVCTIAGKPDRKAITKMTMWEAIWRWHANWRGRCVTTCHSGI